MGRLIVYVLLAALVLYVARAMAPLIVLAVLLLLLVAWCWPVWLAAILGSPRLAALPAQLRATPLAFAGTVAAGALALVWVASALGGSASSAIADEPRAGAPATIAPSATPLAAQGGDGTQRASATTAATAEPTTTPMPTEAQAKSSHGIGLKPTGPTQVAQVVSITDGDTIRVQFGGTEYRLRYIGMDTPETHFGTEPFGPEAADANARLVAGKQVVLEKDVSETDRFGRLLRYVWLHDDSGWLLVNLELVRLGYAQVATYPPDVKWIDPYFLDAQREARQAGRGLWGDVTDAAPPSAAPTPAPATATPRGFVGGSCEPSYPDFCVPLNSPDLDCSDISYRRFHVLWDVPNPDPMRFDRERDGIGCES